MKPKRYLLFCFDVYYPAGGWSDFRGSFDDPDVALSTGVSYKTDRVQVVDLQEGTIVHNFNNRVPLSSYEVPGTFGDGELGEDDENL